MRRPLCSKNAFTFGLESGDTISSVAIDTANIGGPVGKFGDEVTVSEYYLEQNLRMIISEDGSQRWEMMCLLASGE